MSNLHKLERGFGAYCITVAVLLVVCTIFAFAYVFVGAWFAAALYAAPSAILFLAFTSDKDTTLQSWSTALLFVWPIIPGVLYYTQDDFR